MMSNENTIQNSPTVIPSNPSDADLKRAFDTRLENLKLSDAEAEREISRTGQKILRDKIAGVFKITDLINTIFKWNEEAEKAIKGLKRDKLMEVYFQLTEQNEDKIMRLREFMTSTSGNILFNKIVAIADDGPPDNEMLEHLGLALARVVHSDFELLFSAHKHALSQIARLTPQALGILADSARWPVFQLPDRTTNGGIVQSEWNEEFSSAYAAARGINDKNTVARIGHAIAELQAAKLILAAEKDNSECFRCYYTQIGNEIRKYIQI